MFLPRHVSICLLLAVQTASAQQPTRESPLSPPSKNVRAIARQVDAVLRRENGTSLELDDPAPSVVRFRRPTNRVHWNTSVKDQRLVSITVEPIGEEEEGTSILAAALLVSLSAVDSLEEGVRLASLVKQAEATDGRPRQVSLKNGIKLLRLRPDHDKLVYRITL